MQNSDGQTDNVPQQPPSGSGKEKDILVLGVGFAPDGTPYLIGVDVTDLLKPENDDASMLERLIKSQLEQA